MYIMQLAKTHHMHANLSTLRGELGRHLRSLEDLLEHRDTPHHQKKQHLSFDRSILWNSPQ